MTEHDEQGSDAMLPPDYDPQAALERQQRQLAAEEARVTAVTPSRQERGRTYPDPDEPPPAAGAPDYDPLPPTSA